ncbi:hypothetical protein CTAYLR_009344 [Chrysophaeum taylorii]|uniref:HMG box domain-containing protein n=1 Tax=Chrysophaeum taylorii TaxID=2483200 RepID=A0AAD7UAG6_9STRA|nr:hypothetical protein CTAYLR_009344 [Chrysophaeum taylorii]
MERALAAAVKCRYEEEELEKVGREELMKLASLQKLAAAATSKEFFGMPAQEEGGEKKEKKSVYKGQRFLRPSELFANDHRARVRADNPGFLDRAVRAKLSEMWRDADPGTRAEYVERARIEREKTRALRSAPEIARGDAVCVVDDPSRRGIVVSKSSDWVYVDFFRAGSPHKERPWRLRRLPHATSPGESAFEVVSAAQASLDALVVERCGGRGRQLVAVPTDDDDDDGVAVACDVCGGGVTMAFKDAEKHLSGRSHQEALLLQGEHHRHSSFEEAPSPPKKQRTAAKKPEDARFAWYEEEEEEESTPTPWDAVDSSDPSVPENRYEIIVAAPRQQRDSRADDGGVAAAIKAPGPTSLLRDTTFAFDGRLWYSSSSIETTAAKFCLDPIQLRHAQSLIAPSTHLLLPTLPSKKPPTPPSIAQQQCLGGEILEAGERLWYYPRSTETLSYLGDKLSRLVIRDNTEPLPQARLLQARSATAAEELWLEQLQFCSRRDALARGFPRQPIREVSGFDTLLIPLSTSFPTTTTTTRRERVVAILPPASTSTTRRGGRRWVARAAAKRHFEHLARIAAKDDISTIAVALDCDPVALDRRNPPNADLLLLPDVSLRKPCARCRCLGELRRFGCRIVRRHTASPYDQPASLCRVRRRQDGRIIWFFARRVENYLAFEFPKRCRPARAALAEPFEGDIAYCDDVDFAAIDRRCEDLIDSIFRFHNDKDNLYAITDAFYSLEEGVDAIVCEYARVSSKTNEPRKTSLLAAINSTADFVHSSKNKIIS